MKYMSIVLSITLLGIATAWAGQPEMGSYFFPYDSCPGEPENSPLYDCGGGLFICEAADYDVVTRMFLDRNGDPVRYMEWVKSEGGIFYELGNSDNFLPYKRASWTFEYDYIRDLTTFTGPVTTSVVPGHGVIFQDVGRIAAEGLGITPPFALEAGRHDWYHAFFFGEGMDEVCDYLASQ